MASIRKRGGKYQVQVRRKGQAPAARSFNQRKDAQTWARQMELQADRHDLPVDKKVLEGITLRELVERYRNSVTPKKKGRDIETVVLNAFLRHPICRRTLNQLRTSDFALYRDVRLTEVTPVTLKRQLSVIHNVFEIARREWSLPVNNPIDGLDLKAPDQRRERRLREGEWERLIEAARSRRNPYVVPIIIIAVETGMRRGEILGIQWDHFDPQQRCLLIPHSKNGHARTIPLSRRSVEVLNQLPRAEARVFPVTANAFRLAWERVKAKAGIDDLHFHDLRHEAISRFFELGLTTPEVALISGHRDMRMLFRYSHATRHVVRRKLDALTAEAAQV